MEMNENDKQKYIRYFNEVEGKDFDQVIKTQIQTVVKETARLFGLLQSGYEIAGIDSSEYKLIKSCSSSFLNELVKIARNLNVQLQ